VNGFREKRKKDATLKCPKCGYYFQPSEGEAGIEEEREKCLKEWGFRE